MATTRGKAPPTGSVQWLQNERDAAGQFVQTEVEEFSYTVRNELDWLNEHMADIFSKTQVNFADMFKTPGKLRGKTPRTARKVNALAPRQPLTDIFAPNAQPAPPSVQKTAFYDKVAQFQIAQDVETQPPLHKPVTRGTSPQRAGKPMTDSGYHGMMTEDEMEIDAHIQTQSQTEVDTIATYSQDAETYKVPLRDDQPPAQRAKDAKGDDNGASDDSFVSAKEQDSQESHSVNIDQDMEDASPAAVEDTEDDEMMQDENAAPQIVEAIRPQTTATDDAKVSEMDDAKVSEMDQENDVDMDMEDGTRDSETSSPEKPVQRKSSFTFSSLPAREPLNAKRSMGQMDRHRSSILNKSTNKTSQNDADDEMSQEKPPEALAHSKSSTKLLHERLNMLGKTKELRTSRSIPQSVIVGQTSYPQLSEPEQPNSQATEVFEFPAKETSNTQAPIDDDDGGDDDWIAPAKPSQSKQQMGTVEVIEATSPQRSLVHQKSISTTNIPSPMRSNVAAVFGHQKAMSVSHPNLTEALGSTTPVGSPVSKKHHDGPLSASKNRLWSALKSAKNIFASSASTSAAAKLEAHNSLPGASKSHKRDSADSKMYAVPGALYSQKDLAESPARTGSVISFSPSRKTRSSTESDKKREKELKAQQKADEDLEKAREKERQKAAKQVAEEKAKAEKADRADAARLEKELPPPPSNGTSAKLRAPGRLIRPTREAQSKPAPVSIRVASQSQRLGQGNSSQSSFTKSQHESSAPAPAAKQMPPSRSSSAMGNRPGSAAPSNARVKALEAAARKKDADEKAAQKKIEQKREMERKRAEKAEQEKRAEEERKAYEQQRIQEARQAAQRKAHEKQAAENRKREQERVELQRREQERAEQQRREQERIDQQRREAEFQRREEEARKTREAHELADAIRRERAQQAQAHPRGDIPGTLRQLTKNTVPANAAKPSKRPMPDDDDEHIQQSQRPGILRGPASYHQTDAKRRKTNEDQDESNERRSVMAPPKRPSTLRKETMTKFNHGYTHAPPPAAHHASMFKSTMSSQHQMQHSSKPTHPSQLVQMSNARIPFAENANPPASHHPNNAQVHVGYENAQPNKFKTPARPAHAPKSAKSTPHYPQGDNIELPDIATDSEDESDDEADGNGGFRAPSWVASPALRDLLTQQQLVDPETVFGPIGELKMDEVFKNSKNQDRLKRFRDRGSSALWVETGDAVTSAEKRRDMEMRERVVREGGWRYAPGE